MKKFTKLMFATLLGVIMIGSATAQNSNDRAGNRKPVPVKGHVFKGNLREADNVLLLKDENPWPVYIPTDVNETILTNLGVSYTVANSSDIASLDFSPFTMIIIASAQEEDFYTNYNANLSKFTNFLNAGGNMEIHAATYNSISTLPQLPGGGSIGGAPDDCAEYNIVSMPSHPMVAGVPSPFEGTCASIRYFENLPAGAQVITRAEGSNQPTTIEYTVGNGVVVATTCPLEWAYALGEGCAQMLENGIAYTLDAKVFYSLYIAGVQVNEDNASDLSVIEGVSGTVSYDNTTKTLTLNNATVNGKIKSYIENLKIVLTGSNSISAINWSLDIYANTEISGNGSLSVAATNSPAIYLNDPYSSLSIKNCTVEAVSSMFYGIYGNFADLTIDNATVKCTGPEGSISRINSLTLVNCSITSPVGAAFDEYVSGVALNGSLVTEQVVIEPPIETYELYIAGVQVDESNASDFSSIDGVSGTVSYDNTTKTLTLNNATVNGKIKSYIENLKIDLTGSNNISAEYYPLDIYANTEISGNGSLSVAATNTDAIYLNNANSSLSIKNCTVEAVSTVCGIYSTFADLTIDNATVKCTGPEGSISRINSLTLVNCSITSPVGAAFDEDVNGVALNGSLVTEQVVIEPDNGIEDVEILGVSIYPNPAVDFMEISIDDANVQGLDLQVYDMLGKLIIQQSITDQTTQLNIKNLEKGVYILKVGNNTQRFVKN